MDRTKKLLMGVTASALLSGASAEINRTTAKETVLTVNLQIQPDQKVINSATIISQVLYNVPEQNALTLNEILAKRPDLNRAMAEKALDYLKKKGDVRVTGDGTQEC